MYVSVIIDLKAKEIDQLYDYQVPIELKELIQIGTRVVVSFGYQTRIGYVIKIKDKSESATKFIDDIVDPTPLLNEELMMIYNYLETHTTSLKSVILETIMPTEYMMDYEKTAFLNYPIKDRIKEKFNNKNLWVLTKDDNKYFNKLRQLEKDGSITLKTTLKQKVKPKFITIYYYNYTNDYTRINHYLHIINYFNDKEYLTRQELLTITTPGVINTLIKNNVLIKDEIIIKRTILHQFDKKKYDIMLNQEQQAALESLKLGINTTNQYLLFGVTGSGKTEVYVNLIDEVIKSGKNALVLVPEINMISQVAQRLKSSYDNVSIIHSALSPGKKYDQYQMIYNGTAKIVLGTRSAVFAPIDNLGVIIIDEEQDESYLQTEQAIYETSRIAQLRSNYHQCPLVYVSATPKVETMYQAQAGKLKLLTLNKKAVVKERPILKFVDLKEELKSGNPSIISNCLQTEIQDRLNNNQQTIILVNRKGYSPMVMCRTCGYVPKCNNCNISLTYYKENHELKCHYCGYTEKYINTCSNCQNETLIPRGVAIEYVIRELKKMFENAKIIQMDQTTTTKKGSHEKLWYQFLQKDADILVGTQMVAKGFDFPDVTLVAVILADQDLKVSAYNADEKTFVLLEQLIGRSGRHQPGTAIIQGYDLDHFAIDSLKYDYYHFYYQALNNRMIGKYPPFIKMSQVIASGPGFLKTYQQLYLLKEMLLKEGVIVLGPTQASIFKKGDSYRFKLTLKHQSLDIDRIIKHIKDYNTSNIKMVYTPFIDLE